MLKPKYNNISEAVGHFKALLKDMDESNPKDPTILESAPAPARAKKKKKAPKPIAEEKRPEAPQRSAFVSEMRMLAGLEERVLQPRDPGLLSTTRTNKDYFKF